MVVGRQRRDKPRSEPDSGNPTVRDRREASGNVAMGAGLRPTAKAVDSPPDPNVRAPEIYPDGAADKAAIQRVRVPPCQLPDSGT